MYVYCSVDNPAFNLIFTSANGSLPSSLNILTAHAEEQCLRWVRRHIHKTKTHKKIVFRVWRYRQVGNKRIHGLAKPCHYCCKLFRRFYRDTGINIIVEYSVSDGFSRTDGALIDNDHMSQNVKDTQYDRQT